MTLSVNSSASALLALLGTQKAVKEANEAMERLSTGKRINSAKDDAAGVAISSRLDSSVRGLKQSISNALDAQALLDTAEGGMQETEAVLQRLRELSVQAANDTNSTSDRKYLDNEAKQLLAEINSIANSTTWAGQKLLDGSFMNKQFQVGSQAFNSNQFEVNLEGTRVTDLFLVPEQAFNNGTFDSHSFDDQGNLQVPGWSIFNSQIILAQDANNGSSNIAGFPTPSDPTPTPSNSSGKTSRGDGYTPISASYDSTIENGSLRLLSSMTTAIGGDVVHGPYIVSDDPIYLSAEASVSFDWQAKGGSDAFDIFAYLLNVDTGDTQILINQTGNSTASTQVVNEEVSVEKSGNYKFVFVSGTFDYSFGRAAGASLYIDNITVENNLADPKSINGILSLNDNEGCAQAITDIDNAINLVNQSRAYVGALINCLSHIVSNNTNAGMALEFSLSNILDADYAVESARLAKYQILQQGSVAMVAQANASQEDVLQLIKGD